MAKINFKPVMTFIVIVIAIVVMVYAMKNPNFKSMLTGIFQRLKGQGQEQQQQAPVTAPQQPAPAPLPQQQQVPVPPSPSSPPQQQDTPSRAAETIRAKCGSFTGETRLACERTFVAGNYARARIGIA